VADENFLRGKRPAVADDIRDWLAEEEAAAEQWGGLGGAQFYREQFAAARAEIERLRAALEVAANHMSMTGAPQTTIDAIRNAVRGG
jgi:hypothetical protein